MKRIALVAALCVVLSGWIYGKGVSAQSNGTGVLSGEVSDATGAAIAGASLRVRNEATLEDRRLVSNRLGLFNAPLLLPGRYTVVVEQSGFAEVTYLHVAVDVAATQTLHVRLAASSAQHVEVNAEAATIETPPNLGAVTNHALVAGLPLAERNYTQILGLNTGVAAEVADAGSLGRGNTSYAAGAGGFASNGASTNDNNFQMDGVDVNDIQGSGAISRGVPVPNPDAIEEFRVATQPYDAAQGRNSGANINIVTRSGSSTVHGSLFEYFRNDALNANSYFRKATAQPRPALKQNQFGGTLAGPLAPRAAVVGFGSYQETRQSNGLDPSCSSSVALPPLTNDRSAPGLGGVFQGQRGYFQNAFGGVGEAIAADGSNINPVALAILQQKNADGSYLIPTPQSIVSTTGSFDARGFSTFSRVCPYNERQGIANVDWQKNEHHRFAAHTFASNSSTLSTLPFPLLGGAALPSSPSQITDRFRTVSLAYTWVASANVINEARFGFNRLRGTEIQKYPFTFSGVGASVPSFDDGSPLLNIADASIGGSGNGLSGAINTFVGQDALAYTRGRHFVHLGGGIERVQDNQPFLHFFGAALFLTFPDFLLGQNAQQNGTAALCAYIGCGAGYSDIAYAQDVPGVVQRAYRVLSDNAYVQDDVRLSARLTLNVGFRYERYGDLADALGHNTSFYPALANHAPPPGGTLQGYVVPKNYTGALPDGVTRLNNNYGINGDEQNTFQPRAGIAWELPGSDALTLRAGFGLFRSRITADAYNQSVVTPPFARLRQFQGNDPTSASLSLQQPLPAFTQTLPSFAPYCAATMGTCTEAPVFNGLAPDVVPPLFQRYNLDLATTLRPNLTFDLGYAGARGQHLLTQVFINQAAIATPASPVNGETTTTLANLPERVPLPGFSVGNLKQFQTAGSSFYNSLQASLHERARVGELLLSYTWARDLTDTFGATTSQHGGTFLGDQHDPAASYGPDDFLRQQRLVANFLVHLPAPGTHALRTLLGGWQVAGVAVVQSGHALTATYQNQFSAYGVVNDRASALPNCNPLRTGRAERRLSQWFQTACFVKPGVIGDDGVSTGFGNSGLGAIHGPRQTNVDMAASRSFRVAERTALELRGEAFNLFNHAQFADPNTELSSASFGQVQSTSVNPRIVQVALRVSF